MFFSSMIFTLYRIDEKNKIHVKSHRSSAWAKPTHKIKKTANIETLSIRAIISHGLGKNTRNT